MTKEQLTNELVELRQRARENALMAELGLTEQPVSQPEEEETDADVEERQAA